jgi:myo-inositol-1(or 4)-monophosphatase
MLNFAVQIAHEAGMLLLEKFGRQLTVSKKGDINLVTEADLASEHLIVERVRSYYPKHAILAEHNGEIVIGVTYDPTRDEMFAAERGQGATLNSRRIRVSETEDLKDALLVTGFPYDFAQRPNFMHHFTQFILRGRGVRRDGSAALDMAYTACGRFDGFWEEGLNPWDMAAGKLLIEEAGGTITHYDGSAFDIYTPPVCASNGLIHEEMLAVLK